LFGILNLGHWDLFVFWLLVLGIFMIILRRALPIRGDYRAKYEVSRSVYVRVPLCRNWSRLLFSIKIALFSRTD